MTENADFDGSACLGERPNGKSDQTASAPAENPVSPGDIGATIYSLLGIRPDTEIVDRTGRPYPLVHGDPIHALL